MAEIDLESIHRAEYARVLAAVAASTRDLELAEESVQEAFAAALRRWPIDGVPDRPGAWLTTVARRRAIDVARRERRRTSVELVAQAALDDGRDETREQPSDDEPGLDRLRLMFLTCHPSFAPSTRVAMTLRFVVGLTAHEIARLLAISESAVHKQVQRARGKVRDARIPLRFPPAERVDERLPSVLECLRLVFTEGYAATSGEQLLRAGLCRDAIELTRAAAAWYPDDIGARALLALELLQHSRRDTRLDDDGEVVLLEHQDRGRWDRAAIDEASALLRVADEQQRARASSGARSEPSAAASALLLQARIAAVHARAVTFDRTEWSTMLTLYDELLRLTGSDVVALNRVVVLDRVHGAPTALVALRRIDVRRIGRRHLWHAVCADLLQSLGDAEGAVRELGEALGAGPTAPEAALLEARRQRMISAASSATITEL